MTDGLSDQRSRKRLDERRTRDVVRALLHVWGEADEPGLRRLLTPRATLVVDSDGRGTALIRSRARRASVAAALTRIAGDWSSASWGEVGVNGQPGLALQEDGQVIAVISIGLRGGRIEHVWITEDPRKLTHWNAAGPEASSQPSPPAGHTHGR